MSLGGVLATLFSLLMVARFALHEGWVDRVVDAVSHRQRVVFPESGSVAVTPIAMKASSMGSLDVSGNPERDSVLRFTRADTNEYVMSIYIRRGEQAQVPVPTGRYRLDIASGSTWYGRREMFGFDERLERAAGVFEFSPAIWQGIELHRRINGNLRTVVEGHGRFHEQAVREL